MASRILACNYFRSGVGWGMSTITEFVTLTQINCGECGATYAINERYRSQKEDKGGGWHCPYCQCGWGYFGKTEAQKLKEQLELEQKRLTAARAERDSALLEVEHFRKSRDGMKGAYRKVAVRVKNGVCPCCKRTFSCLAEHMKTKHPDFSTTPAA